ncbi:hypothetical protein B0H14DRAFT_2619962 [Mycena olivaceomarginata]|nr:hypothetical protein B0H14DRAFT_2619962 [Mycena olivaceomarginata]
MPGASLRLHDGSIRHYPQHHCSTDSSTSSLLNFDWGLDYLLSYQYNTPRRTMFPAMPGVSNSAFYHLPTVSFSVHLLSPAPSPLQPIFLVHAKGSNGISRGQITKLALHNREFPNIGSLIQTIDWVYRWRNFASSLNCLNTGNDLKVMLQDLSFAVSSAFQSPGSTTQFHLSVWSDTDSKEWETIWGTIDKVVKVESVATSMKFNVDTLTQRSEAWNIASDRNETAAPPKSPGVLSPRDVGLSLTEARLGWQKVYADPRQQRRARWWSEAHTNNTLAGGNFDVDILTSRSGDSGNDLGTFLRDNR